MTVLRIMTLLTLSWRRYLSSAMLNSALALPTDQDKQGRVDVTSLLVGLITAGVVIVIVGLLIWYFCQAKWKNNLDRST